jgi:hypothetical protein
MVQRQPQQGVSAHRRSGQDGPLDPGGVEDRHQVAPQLLVAVLVRLWRRRGVAVTAGVVGDQPMAGARQRGRAHNHVAPRRRQAVQQHHRPALPVFLAGKFDSGVLDGELGHTVCLPDPPAQRLEIRSPGGSNALRGRG